MDYSWLWDFLSADTQNGRLKQQFLPGYRGQQGRAQLAKSRAYDETVNQAKAMAAAKEMALREKANEEARSAYNAAHGIAPMALAGPQQTAPQQQVAPPQAPARPYPERGTSRPPVMQGAPAVAPAAPPPIPQRRPAPPQPPVAPPPAPPQAVPPQISPQDYYAMLQSGMFRMG